MARRRIMRVVRGRARAGTGNAAGGRRNLRVRVDFPRAPCLRPDRCTERIRIRARLRMAKGPGAAEQAPLYGSRKVGAAFDWPALQSMRVQTIACRWISAGKPRGQPLTDACCLAGDAAADGSIPRADPHHVLSRRIRGWGAAGVRAKLRLHSSRRQPSHQTSRALRNASRWCPVRAGSKGSSSP